MNRHALRQRALNLVERRVDFLGELQRIRARLFLNTNDDRRLCVVRSVAALDRRADLNGADIANEHRNRVLRLHHRSADIRGVRESPDAADQILLSFGDRKPSRRILVRRRQRPFNLRDRDVVRLKARRVEHDFVLLLLPSGRDHLRHAGHRQQPAPDNGVGGGAKLDG